MKKYLGVFIFVIAIALAGCKKEDTTTTDTTTTTTTGTTATTSTVSAFPSDLAISSNTESVSTTSANWVAAQDGSTMQQDQKSKKERLKKAKNPTVKADCFAALKGMAAPMGSPLCYGPTLYYTKHPDHPNKDASADTLSSCPQNQGPDAAGTGCLPGGDLGIWSAAEADGTACSAAKLNSVIQSAAQSVDMGIGAAAAMACVAKLNSNEMPAVGKTLDLTASLSADADMKTMMTMTNATITRESDTAAGLPVFTSKMDISMTPPGGSTAQSLSLTLRHVPQDASNDTYKGLLTMVRSGGSTAPPKPMDPPPSKNLSASSLNAVSVVYEQTATALNYKIISANYSSNATTTTIFDSTTGEVNLAAPATSNQASDGWNGNLNVIVGNLDASGDGKLSVAWQAGPLDGYTRNFNVDTTTDTAGVKTGTAYFGFAENVANKAPDLTIGGMICNWAGPNNQKKSAGGWSYVQKQTMKLDTATGKWKPVVSNIDFAPTNDCNWLNVTGSTYSTSAITTATTKGAVTHNLVSKSTGYTYTQPTAPTAP